MRDLDRDLDLADQAGCAVFLIRWARCNASQDDDSDLSARPGLVVCHIQTPAQRVCPRKAGPHRTPAGGRTHITRDRRRHRKVQEALRETQALHQGPPPRSVPPPLPFPPPHPAPQARPSPATPPCSEVCLSPPSPSPLTPCRPDFQLAFCPTYFHREIPVWKVIIQLNLIGYVSPSVASPYLLTLRSSIKRLLAIIEDELDSLPASPSFPPSDQSTVSPSSSSGTSSPLPLSPGFATINHPLRQPSLDLKENSADPPLTQAHAALRLRLLPLLSAETNLARLLLPEFGGEAPPLPSSTGWSRWASGAGDNAFHQFLQGNGEICVRAGGAWKSILERVTGTLRSPSDSEDPSSDDYLTQHIEPRSTPLSGRHTTRNTRPHPSDPTPLLEALAPDIHALWIDPAVRALLKRKGILMEHSAGFFLNDVLRIAGPGWQPGIGSYTHVAYYPSSHTSRRRYCTS